MIAIDQARKLTETKPTILSSETLEEIDKIITECVGSADDKAVVGVALCSVQSIDLDALRSSAQRVNQTQAMKEHAPVTGAFSARALYRKQGNLASLEHCDTVVNDAIRQCQRLLKAMKRYCTDTDARQADTLLTLIRERAGQENFSTVEEIQAFVERQQKDPINLLHNVIREMQTRLAEHGVTISIPDLANPPEERSQSTKRR